VGLTPAGRKYFVQVQDIFERIETATRALRADGMGEELSVHATPSFASLWLMPKISEFMSTRPDVRIKIDASPTPANFAADKVDLDIQYGQTYSRELYTQPLVRDRLTAFCSPDYFDRLGRPTSPAQLASASFIRNVFNRTQWSDWFAANGVYDLSIDFCLQTPRSMLAIQAALDGIGVALESQVICSQHLRAGRLVKMFPASIDIESTDYFLVCPKNNIELPLVRTFINWLVGEVSISNGISPETPNGN
jgi:LysR family glycine cleavage system transcriptional activator